MAITIKENKPKRSVAFRRIFKKFPRLNLIVTKKQALIAGLTLVLGAAVYTNYVYFSHESADLTKTGAETTYGEAALVSTSSQADEPLQLSTASKKDTTEAYFAQARLDKQSARDEAKEFLAAMYNGGDSTSEELAVIARDAEVLGDYIESENKVETLIKSQGFADALVYLSDKGASVIVKTEDLTPDGAAKIKNALLSEVTVPAEDITIVEVN